MPKLFFAILKFSMRSERMDQAMALMELFGWPLASWLHM
jgi:hypothetical protein